MARFNERTNVTPKAMRSYATGLRALADMHEMLAAQMEASKLKAVDSTHMKTAVAGMVNLSKFLGAVTSAYCDNLNAAGVAELSGGVAEIRRLTKRLSRESEELREGTFPSSSTDLDAEARREASQMKSDAEPVMEVENKRRKRKGS